MSVSNWKSTEKIVPFFQSVSGIRKEALNEVVLLVAGTQFKQNIRYKVNGRERHTYACNIKATNDDISYNRR
ncbi:MAG TPA: hypothetical protein VEV15_13745 [Flavisolibacter sp.]|nr:hypothetical protein [Flavisolibacter sp.]